MNGISKAVVLVSLLATSSIVADNSIKEDKMKPKAESNEFCQLFPHCGISLNTKKADTDGND